jgi:bacterial/archaeal transporter family-2 protein
VQIVAMFMSLIAGALISVQGVFNSQIGKEWSLPSMIVSVSLIQASLALLWMFKKGEINQGFLSIFNLPVWVAGLLGVLIMASIAWAISYTGALPVFVLVIFGQIVLSAVIDGFGLFGVEQKALTTVRVVSIGLIASGTLLLLKVE